MKDKKFAYIKCPCCGKQYLPGEIFMPKDFLGQPRWVERDTEGRITDFDKTMDLEEKFTCEDCLTPFKVSAKVIFDTIEDNVYNFNNDYRSQIIETPSLFLNEEEND